MTFLNSTLVMLAVALPLTVAAQDVDNQQTIAASQSNADSMQAQAAEVFNTSQARTTATLAEDKASLSAMVATAETKKSEYLRAMYRQNLPSGVATKIKPQGEQILMFASKSMPDGDMRSLLQDALADKRITIKFLGGESEGGVPALTHWLSEVAHGLDRLPTIQIDPPSFHKYKVTKVPFAVILNNGDEVARVGGVYSTKWIDDELQRTSGDLGTYGAMSTPVEVDMQQLIEDRVKQFDWNSYLKSAVANFWRDQKMPTVPHASEDETWRLDPTTTITHDIRLPSGLFLAHAGDKANPLSVASLDATLLIIDASDPAQRAYAHDQVLHQGKAGHVVVMSTAVPGTAPDGWAAWNDWQNAVGAHLYIYSQAYADRFKLTGTPAFITGDGLLLKVRQVALPQGSAS